MKRRKFFAAFDSDIYKVKGIVTDALMFIKSAFPDVSEDSFFEIKLVLNEALLNAVKHGNDMDRSKTASLLIKILDKDELHIQISDEGEGFDYDEALKQAYSEGVSLSENGRGIKLVNSLSENVSYSGRGNKINIYKKVVSNG